MIDVAAVAELDAPPAGDQEAHVDIQANEVNPVGLGDIRDHGMCGLIAVPLDVPLVDERLDDVLCGLLFIFR